MHLPFFFLLRLFSFGVVPIYFKCSILCIFFQTIGDTILFIMDTFSYEVYFVGENYTLFRAKLAKFKNTENMQVLPILLLQVYTQNFGAFKLVTPENIVNIENDQPIPYIFATQCCRPIIFKTLNSV